MNQIEEKESSIEILLKRAIHEGSKNKKILDSNKGIIKLLDN